MLSTHHGCFTLFQHLSIYLATPGISCSTQDLQSSWQHGRSLSSSMQTLSCSRWNLVPWPEMDPGSPALGAQSLNHWTTRKSPTLSLGDVGLGRRTQSSCCLSWYEFFVSDPGEDVFCRQVPKCDWVTCYVANRGKKSQTFHSSGQFNPWLRNTFEYCNIWKKEPVRGNIPSNLPFIFHFWSWVTVSSSLLI